MGYSGGVTRQPVEAHPDDHEFNEDEAAEDNFSDFGDSADDFGDMKYNSSLRRVWFVLPPYCENSRLSTTFGSDSSLSDRYAEQFGL